MLDPIVSGDLMQDDFDNLVSLLHYPEAPQGLDDLLHAPSDLGNLDFLLHDVKTELSDNINSGVSRGVLNTVDAGPSAGPSDDTLPQQEEEHEHEQGDSKRRRRIRNAKQQELNRLAQQRYRQRKKQKFSDLQVTVEELSSKMATIARLEDEAGELRRREVAANELAASRQATLLQAQVAMQQQAQVIEQQRKQLEAMKAQQQQQMDGSTPPAASTPAQQQQQSALCDRLVEALREALAEVCEEQGLHASSAAQEQVLLRFRRSVHSCCKEVAGLAVMAGSVDEEAVPQGPAPVPTSAGSQKPAQSARLVSIPCY